MKRVFLFALVLVLAIGAALPAAAQDDNVLEVYITGLGEATMDWFRTTAFPAFQETHPDVQMEVLTGTWGDFDATVAGWITTGSGPDLVYLGSEYASNFCDQLADMDPYLADWEELPSFLPSALQTVTCDGHMRGLPLLMSARPIYYRTDLMADPTLPLTFDDFLAFTSANSAVADGAVTKQAYMDIGQALFDPQEFIGYIWSQGGELYNEDGSSTFDSDLTRSALQFMYDRRRAILPDEQTAGLPPAEGSPMASGNVVSGNFALWQMPPLGEAVWENIALGPLPAGPDGAPVIQVYTDWLSVPAYVQNKELAADFLKFITSRENAITLSTVAGFTPTRTDAWEDLRASNPFWGEFLDLAQEHGRAFADIRGSAELRPMITEQVNLFLTDQQSIDDTMQNLKDEYDAILEDGGYLE